MIRPLGLTRRAGTLKEMAAVVNDVGGVPSALDGLLALPGVGPYAAGATLAVAFGRRTPVVDGRRPVMTLVRDGKAPNRSLSR